MLSPNPPAGQGGVDIVMDPVGGDDRFTDPCDRWFPAGRLLVVGFTGEILTVKVNRLVAQQY